MIVVDVFIIVACLSVIATVLAALRWGYKIWKKFEDLPERVEALEKNQHGCQARKIDVDKFNETLDVLTTNMKRDYARIEQLTSRQMVVMDGTMNMFEHIINGNHIKEIKESYNKMVRELVKRPEDCFPEEGGV